MEQWLQEVVKIGGSFLAGWFTHVFVVRRDLASRRRNFRSHLFTVHAQLQSTSDDQFFAVHQSSIPKVRDECARIQEDIPSRCRSDFIRAAQTYCTLRQRDMEPLIQGDFPPDLADEERAELTFQDANDYRPARQRLTGLLSEMISHAR